MLGNLRVWTSSSIRSVFLYHRYSTKTIRRESARWAVNPPKKIFQLVADLKRKLMALRWSISAVTVSFFFFCIAFNQTKMKEMRGRSFYRLLFDDGEGGPLAVSAVCVCERARR